jgi:hypothetical protein
MAEFTPEKKTAKSINKESPTSITHFDADVGKITLSNEGIKFIEDNFLSEDDPFIIIHWIQDGVMDALEAIHGAAIEDLPPAPLFVNLETPE